MNQMPNACAVLLKHLRFEALCVMRRTVFSHGVESPSKLCPGAILIHREFQLIPLQMPLRKRAPKQPNHQAVSNLIVGLIIARRGDKRHMVGMRPYIVYDRRVASVDRLDVSTNQPLDRPSVLSALLAFPTHPLPATRRSDKPAAKKLRFICFKFIIYEPACLIKAFSIFLCHKDIAAISSVQEGTSSAVSYPEVTFVESEPIMTLTFF